MHFGRNQGGNLYIKHFQIVIPFYFYTNPYKILFVKIWRKCRTETIQKEKQWFASTRQKTKDLARTTRTKKTHTGDNNRCSWRVNSSCIRCCGTLRWSYEIIRWLFLFCDNDWMKIWPATFSCRKKYTCIAGKFTLERETNNRHNLNNRP